MNINCFKVKRPVVRPENRSSRLANNRVLRFAHTVKIIRGMTILVLLAAVFGLLQGLFTGFPDPDALDDEWGLEVEQAFELEAVLWVDARTEAAYLQDHHPGAVHLTRDDWDAGLGNLLFEWEPGVAVIVYCDGDGCESSMQIASQLREELGEDTIYWLAGGWPALKAHQETL